MTNQHPIQPSPELVEQCMEMRNVGSSLGAICIIAAQWGADQELDACCKWLECNYNYPQANPLRVARRPKPPSLKEQALRELGDVYSKGQVDDTTYETIANALEALPND